MTPRSEAAIAKWLKLPKGGRTVGYNMDRGIIYLYEIVANNNVELIATLSLASIIKKRYAARKKKGNK